MNGSRELDDLKAAARLIVVEELRSKAAILARLAPEINRAISLGHRHTRIHEVLVLAGVKLSFGVYETTLNRVRKRQKLEPQVATPTRVDRGSPEPIPESPASTPSRSQESKPNTESQPQTEFWAGNAFAVRNALKDAQAVGQKDYRKFARRKP